MSSRFEVLEALDSNQRAALFRVRDMTDGRERTIRRYHADAEELDGQRELMRTIAGLGHPNLETVFEVGSDEEGLFAVVEAPWGRPLSEVLKGGPLSEHEFEHLAKQVLLGMLVLHERGISHTSLRPEVVRVETPASGQMEVRVTGFGEGFGRKSEETPADPAAYRCTAPEQWNGEAVGRRTDVYALGCIFYEALSGRPPFKPVSLKSLRAAHLGHDVVPLATEAPQVKPWMAAWVMKLIDPDMNSRPRDAATARKLFELRDKGVRQDAGQPQFGMPPGYGAPQQQGYQYNYPGFNLPPGASTASVVPMTAAVTPHHEPATSTTGFQPIAIAPVRPLSAPQPVMAQASPAPGPPIAARAAPAPSASGVQKLVAAVIGNQKIAISALGVVLFGLLIYQCTKPTLAPLSVRREMTLPVTSGLVLHLDASRIKTMETNLLGKVTRWKDADISTRSANPPTPENGPTVIMTALNGLPALDFGRYGSAHWMEFKKADGSMNRLTNIRTVFWVMRGAGFLLGDDSGTAFHRGDPEGSADATLWRSAAADSVKRGVTKLNGVKVNGEKTPLPTSFALISLVTTGNTSAARLCNDRNASEGRIGGQQIAEIVVYDRALDEVEVKKVEAYLGGKWLGPL